MKDNNLFIIYAACIVIGIIAFAAYQTYAPSASSVPAGQGVLARQALELSAPTPTSTQEERQAYFSQVSQAEVSTDSIDVSGCRPNPGVSLMKKGASVAFGNRDAVPHKIIFSPAISIALPARSTETVPADFGGAAGIYVYHCDSATSSPGIVVLQ